jgi:DNA polymerase-3 subunit alpha
MATPHFVHLRMHSEYSIKDGLIRLDVVVKNAAGEKKHMCPPIKRSREFSMPALGITDSHNLFGLIKFYKAARDAGIKPILGSDVRILRSDNETPFRVAILCQNTAGYRNLNMLLTHSFRANPDPSSACVHWDFLEKHSEGLIVLSGFMDGDVGQAIRAGDRDGAIRLAESWQDLLGDRYYMEIQRFGHPQEKSILDGSVAIADTLNIPLVATHPIEFLDKEEFDVHEARVAIADKLQLNDPTRARRFTTEQYFRSPSDMVDIFSDLPDAIENSFMIAQRCNLEIDLGKPRLPFFPIPSGMTMEEFLISEAKAGLEKRLISIFPDPAVRAQKEQVYWDRLDFEIKTIVNMGFPGYFLIVADFIRWSKEHDVPVGPGRGSGAGSIVAYSLGITDIDPLPYDLLFERFLNPDRVSMPDFDVDFCQEGRDRVIQYVKNKYGHDSVSQIATFGVMAARSVIRDAGRALGLTYGKVDDVAKMIPEGPEVTLDSAFKDNPDIRYRMSQDKDVDNLVTLALKLEGMTRNVGMHAGGVVIAPGNITDFCSLYATDESSFVSQFDKDDIEAAGLVKFDFLGLRTLTILKEALRLLREDNPDFNLDLRYIPMDDSKTYELLKAQDTTAVFQLEGSGMRNLVKKLQPDNFEDLIALVALYRPGPLESGMVDDFIDRKHGRSQVDYMHPMLETVLKPTYGVIVYQEQVMQIAQVMGGYTLGSADLLRRAMGKKKADEMAEHRNIFVKGAVERGVSADKASGFFDLMEKFAAYGFNKSHSAAYALVSYQTAYLKAHYPEAFLAATLSSEMSNTDKVSFFIDDCRDHKIAVFAPDINISQVRFSIEGKHGIRYGLGGVKQVGESALHAIMEARVAGPFKGFMDFLNRVDRRVVNKEVLQNLIRSGAFDSIEPNRAWLFDLSEALHAKVVKEKAPRARTKKVSENQIGLFGDEPVAAVESPPEITVPEPELWDLRRILEEETKSLGFAFTAHLMALYKEMIDRTDVTPIAHLRDSKRPFLIAGIISNLMTKVDKKGNMMAFVQMDDGQGKAEVAVFSSVYENVKKHLVQGAFWAAEVNVKHNEERDQLSVMAERGYDEASFRKTFDSEIVHVDPLQNQEIQWS